MDSLQLIQTFCEVARRSSFSATARAQGVTPATVSKAIAQLEQRFGLRLFHRTTRKVTLTDAGHLLFQRSGALLELIDLTQGELHERATHPSGRLSLTAPHDLMQTELPMLLAQYLKRHPDVSISMHVTDRVVNLVDEGIDLAFRIGAIDDANVIVKRLLPITHVAAASPQYWQRHGKPTHPAQLRDHAQLAYSLYGEAARWQFQVDGKPFELPLDPVFSVTDHTPLAALAAQGLGVIWTARRAINTYIARDELEPALEEYTPVDLWLHVAYMERRYKTAALRVLLAELQDYADAMQSGATQAAAGA
ncbi:MAG: LysR family transcriptional regulator [Ottowia sp.]|nr:LysR family transcriptional regulator [Ottowia sp.]